jgi:unsaturated rhamnogalacturonyl hydrolase
LDLANLYEVNNDHTYIPYLDTWAEWVMDGLPRTEEDGFQHIVYNDENPQEMWDDTLMMSVLPLAKIGKLLNRPHYIEEAKKQFLIHIKYLFDRKTGLWYHGWTFDGRHNFAEALWARGNCWITIAIPEIIELLDLPEDDAFRRFLLETLEFQIKTLSETQDSSGLWHTLVMDPTSYLEASATAGFAYGILKSVRKKYISKEYLPVGIKAVEGVLANIDEDGELKQVSFGTAMGEDLQFYKDIALTSMPYGQSLAICALGEFLRTYI